MSKELNPKLWENGKLKKDVSERIIEIVGAFVERLLVTIDIIDIHIVGSNASYNYTDNSDIDVHIVTNFETIGSPEEVVQALYNSERARFNSAFEITIKGIPVEIYVEDVRTGTASNGIYSVINDEWIKKPKRQAVTVRDMTNDESVLAWEKRIKDALLADTSDEIREVINALYLMRKNSIASEGEYGYGNLVFKELRNRGLLDKLKNAYDDRLEDELTLEALY